MSFLGNLQCQSSKSWLFCGGLLLGSYLVSGHGETREGKEERSLFRGGTEGCFRESTNPSDSEMKIAIKCPTTWDSRPEESSG